MGEIVDIEFNKGKFKHVLHHIIYRYGYLENVCKTVLYKILYFTDFDCYELYEEKLTGELYRKLPLGPAPVHFEEVIEELEEGGKIQQFPIMRGKFEQQKFLSTEKPNIDLLNGKEVQLIEEDIARYVSMNAIQISAFSHRDRHYKATGDIIKFLLVSYNNCPFRT